MTTRLREAPQDTMAENHLVGSILVGSSCWPAIQEWVSLAHFINPDARRLYEIMQEIASTEGYQAIDPVLVHSRAKFSEKQVVFDYEKRLLENIYSNVNAVYYARRVNEKYIERELACLVQHGAMALEDQELTTQEKIETLAAMSGLARNFCTEDQKQTVADLINKLSQDLTADGTKGFSTGFNAIDHFVGGLGPGQLVLVAGATSMGKTSLLLDMFIHAARIGQRPYYYYLEMLAIHLAQRLVMNIARVPKELVDPTLPAIRETQMLVEHWPAWIEQRPQPTIGNVILQIQAKKQRDNIGAVFIDHIQKIQGLGRDTVQQLSYVSNALSLMACDLKIPVICACHVNRETLNRDNHIPKLSDLRGSGSLENDADVVMILHREDYYREQKDENPELDGLAQCYVLKNRHGKKGIAQLVWLPEYATFADLAREF